MTGFQPHPGIGLTAMGKTTEPISIAKVVEAIGCPVTVADPFDITGTTEIVYKLLKQPGLKVLILKQECATLAIRKREKAKVWVDQDLCRGDECGCGRFCSRIWGCPGNIWDYEVGKAKIDEVVCVGCGVCVSLCPAGANQDRRGRSSMSKELIKDPLNIIICGVGGQGNILATELLASALVEKGYFATVGETYGASQRGGSVMSHVRISAATGVWAC